MSDLTQIQQEILRRFQRPPTTTVDDIPGYAGGNLGQQIRPRQVAPGAQSDQRDFNYDDERPRRVVGEPNGAVRRRSVFAPPQQPQEPVSQPVTQPSWMGDAPPAETPRVVQSPPQTAVQPTSMGQVLTPTNQASITRPRSVFAPPRQPDNTPFGSSGQPFEASRDRRVEPRDRIADDAQYLSDLQSRPPKRTDKIIDAVRGVNQALGSNPSVFTPTERERDILKARGMLGQDLEIQKAQTAQQMAQMVPIYDANGNVVGTAPRRTAASTQIRATDTAGRLAETKRRNDAYVGHLNDLPVEKRAEAARKIWASGVADGNDELKADLAQRMGLKETLPDSDKGTLRTDANGNFTVVHTRAGTAQTVTDETGKPKQSWVITKEQRIDDRARRSQAAAMQRTLVMAQATGARLGNPEDLDTIANEAQANADAATAKAQSLSASTKPSDKKLAGEYLSEAGRHRAQAIRAREAATKARSGQGFTGGTSARGSQGSFNLGAWKADNPNATADQIQAQRSKAKARNLSIVE